MTLPQKAALSLLISVVLAAGFSVLAFTGFFNLVETRFYNPSITNFLAREVEFDAGAIQDFLDEARERFAEPLETDAVKRSFLPNQSAQDIFERTRLYGMLLESQNGLQSVRFVDSGGIRIHFSTDSNDIAVRGAASITYKNYDEALPFASYQEVAVPSSGSPKITLDEENERIIFSFPFTDSTEIYRGTALYSLSIRAVAERLIASGRIKIGENLSIVSNPPGMVSGLPGTLDAAQTIVQVVSSIWQEGILNLTALDSAASDTSLALISAKTPQGLFVGKVVNESLFEFPHSMKLILLAAIFLTAFLSIFLAFNLAPDPLTVVQNRLKNLQLSLIREYYERKGEMDWNHWYRELEERREDVRIELKRGIKEKPALLEDIDSLIDKSWDEILGAIGGKRETRLAIDEDKLQNILSRMLATTGSLPLVSAPGTDAVPAVVPAAASQPAESPLSKGASNSETIEELDEIEEAGEVDDVEELDEVEELNEAEGTTVSFTEPGAGGGKERAESAEPEDAGAETLEEVEELEEVEALDEAEPAEASVELGGAKEAPRAAGENVPQSTPPSAGKSNIQLVFGEDDIPTLMESSGLELVDELTGGVDFDDEEAGELEALEEFEDLSVESAAPLSSPPLHELDIASQIEFGNLGKPEDDGESIGESGFVIVSPFSSMFSGLDDEESGAPDTKGHDEYPESGLVEESGQSTSMSLVHVPFQNEDRSEPEELPSEDPSVIKQKNGVHYVDEKVKTPDQETSQSLDPGLKNLVDSVIGKKQTSTAKKQTAAAKKQTPAVKKQTSTAKKQTSTAKKQTPAAKKQTPRKK